MYYYNISIQILLIFEKLILGKLVTSSDLVKLLVPREKLIGACLIFELL